MALSMTVIPSVLWAQKPATEHTIRANETVNTELNFNDRQDFEDANRGFIASIDGKAVLGKDGKVSYSVAEINGDNRRTNKNCDNKDRWRAFREERYYATTYFGYLR